MSRATVRNTIHSFIGQWAEGSGVGIGQWSMGDEHWIEPIAH